MKSRTLPATVLLLLTSGLALCAPNPIPNPGPNPRPIAGPDADPNIDSDGNQVTLTSEAYYGSDAGVSSPNDSPPPASPSTSLLPKVSEEPVRSNTFSVKATTSTDDENRRKYLDREGIEKEYDTLQSLKEQLQALEEEVKEREGWFHDVICPGKPEEHGECASPVCAFSKVFATAAGGLRKRGGAAGEKRCWEGTERKEFPLPAWRGGNNGTGKEGRRYDPPGWIKVLNSGVSEVLVIVLGVGLAVLSWGLLRDGRKNNDEESGQRRRRGCCGVGRRRRRAEEENVEEREKLAGFGEHEHEYLEAAVIVGEESESLPRWEEQRFEIESVSESEDEVTRSTYNIPRPHQQQQQEEAERRIQAWEAASPCESEGWGMVADGLYTGSRPTFGQEDRERRLREQDLAARRRYALSESGSDTLAGTRSPSEVDSLEGVSMSQELAAFRDAFGMVEDLVASVEQRRRQI